VTRNEFRYFFKEAVKCKNYAQFAVNYVHRVQQWKMPFHQSIISLFVSQEGLRKCAEYIVYIEFVNKRQLLLSNK